MPMWRTSPSSTNPAIAPHVSSSGTPVESGQCSWYRSIQSVDRRLRLPRHASCTWSGRKPVPEGRGATLVAKTISSRRPWMARATSSSEVPSPYTSAVSIHVIPASRPARMASITRSSDWLGPHMSPPASHAPNPITEISGPKDPSRAVFMSRTAFPVWMPREAIPSFQKSPHRTDITRRGMGGITQKSVEEKERVVVRFAGDSGDGMQLTGDRFTNATAILGNDLATMPDFPAEIRAPAGTVHGVSAFQIQFASSDITTPGDHPNVLVAMNPAALKAELSSVEPGGIVIVNEDAFVQRNLDKAGYAGNPLEDGTLAGYQVYRVPMTSITVRAVEELGLTRKEAERAKNMFALGLVSWMYGRPTEVTLNWLHKKFGDKPQIYDANVASFKAGYNFGETTELFATSYVVKRAPAAPGIYRNISGASALAFGLVAAATRSGLRLFYASYPITPASELLPELSRLKNFGVLTLQAEDEIAAAGIELGASFAGHLGVTGTSGPGK